MAQHKLESTERRIGQIFKGPDMASIPVEANMCDSVEFWFYQFRNCELGKGEEAE